MLSGRLLLGERPALKKRTPRSGMLKTLLEVQRITLAAVAAKTGVKRSTLSDWLSGSSPRDMKFVSEKLFPQIFPMPRL